MNSPPVQATDLRRCLPPWLAVALLGIFLAVRGLVPAGFMPASIAAGSPYEFCHGDSRSALLLNLISAEKHADSGQLQHIFTPDHGHGHGHHQTAAPADPAATNHGHQHDSATAQAFSDNHCNFAASVAFVAGAEKLLWIPLPGSSVSVFRLQTSVITPQYYLLPPGRAPPIALSLA
ncbi:hypothetical protein PVT68_12490 [Microbulbifer bruguierae]|uniref:DUF2946 domain-containing protein n=1 Tax=Microbulbifer bruguierae TaxID=3029061 RepID=A0ABY8NCV3_9GAMM|nr:hypothetical protein [Microbulbifer bruguierae]WGL15587.1 hypothetical protein PVT68_12490 [Microbulbifer bruguierae]